jgi:hypothetical protein
MNHLQRQSLISPVKTGHTVGMAEISRTTMLEVSTALCKSLKWEWQVSSGGAVCMSGYEDGQLEARFAGYNAMFRLLATGWKP